MNRQPTSSPPAYGDGVKPPTDLVLITGLSGAGKSSAARCFEEMGYFTVDNLPPSLLPTFTALCGQRDEPIEHLAVVIDVRGRELFETIAAALDDLDEAGLPYRILYLDADDDTLVSRFKEHRVPHPLASRHGSLLECIEAERGLLEEMKSRASVVLDTGGETVRELRGEILRLFPLESGERTHTVQIVTFGFKYGLPPDVDYVFDVRFLRNPHHVPELRPFTGDDPRVAAYVYEDERTAVIIDQYKDLLDFVLPEHWTEGRFYVSVGVGCTGGKHRSVVVGNALAEHCEQLGYRVVLQHRNRGQE